MKHSHYIQCASPQRLRDPLIRTIQYLYTALFTIELLIRIAADGCHLFCGEDWAWGVLDLFIVLFSLWEVSLEAWFLTVMDAALSSILSMFGLNAGRFHVIRFSKFRRGCKKCVAVQRELLARCCLGQHSVEIGGRFPKHLSFFGYHQSPDVAKWHHKQQMHRELGLHACTPRSARFEDRWLP